MNENSNEILCEVAKAPLMEKVATESGYVCYFGFPKNGNTNECRIKRVSYLKNGSVETWTTTHPNGSKFFAFDWSKRAEYNYKLSR